MASSQESVLRRLQAVFFHENVIRIESGNGNDPDFGVGERIEERRKNSGHFEWEWALQLKAHPIALGVDRDWDQALLTNDGELVGSAGDGLEMCARDPFGNGSVGSETADGKPALQDGIAESMIVQAFMVHEMEQLPSGAEAPCFLLRSGTAESRALPRLTLGESRPVAKNATRTGHPARSEADEKPLVFNRLPQSCTG